MLSRHTVAGLFYAEEIVPVCLRQWNVLDEDGKPLPLSRDNRHRLKGSLVVAVAERIVRRTDETQYPPPQLKKEG